MTGWEGDEKGEIGIIKDQEEIWEQQRLSKIVSQPHAFKRQTNYRAHAAIHENKMIEYCIGDGSHLKSMNVLFWGVKQASFWYILKRFMLV